MTSVVILYALAALDGTLVGYRDVMGRNPLQKKGKFCVMAFVRGALFVHLVLLAIAAAIVATFWLSTLPFERVWDAYMVIAPPMARCYGAYAVVIGLGLSAYMLPNFELRSYITIGLFGFLTLLRPWVIALGAAWAWLQVIDLPARWAIAPSLVVIVALMTQLDRFTRWFGWNAFDWDPIWQDEAASSR